VQQVAPTPETAEKALVAEIQIANKIAACGPLGIKTTLISAQLSVDPEFAHQRRMRPPHGKRPAINGYLCTEVWNVKLIRCAVADGSVSIESKSNQGTTIRAWIPVVLTADSKLELAASQFD
jgi:hypothetical protein